jgi:glycosyltransferase involved in cell wall biosynthesis
LKIGVLWITESDYVWSWVEALRSRGHLVLLSTFGVTSDAPYAGSGNDTRNVQHLVGASESELRAEMDRFSPDVMIVAGWHIDSYVGVATAWRGKCCRILAFDNQWRSSIRQNLGRVAFEFKYRRAYDAAIVPGPRQALFAEKMGFARSEVFYGALPCNYPVFAGDSQTYGRAFLTACRLSPEKGLDILLTAYRRYRQEVEDPWELWIAGTGSKEIPPQAGIRMLGFLNASELAGHMKQAGAFVLASTFEPWGLVIQEAAVSGRPIIATDECGAVGTFLVDGVNGRTVRAGSDLDLYVALREIASMREDELALLGERSRILGARSTPETLVGVVELVASKWSAGRLGKGVSTRDRVRSLVS